MVRLRHLVGVEALLGLCILDEEALAQLEQLVDGRAEYEIDEYEAEWQGVDYAYEWVIQPILYDKRTQREHCNLVILSQVNSRYIHQIGRKYRQLNLIIDILRVDRQLIYHRKPQYQQYLWQVEFEFDAHEDDE